MGTWSADNFGNDAALDFVGDLTDFSALKSTLMDLSQSERLWDVEEACVALAACDALTVVLGRGPTDVPDALSLQQGDVADELLEVAKSLVARVRDGSELAELWAEEDDEELLDVLDDLLIRLTPTRPYVAPERKAEELPKDFLGYCYVCYGMVTRRDGFYFEHDDEEGISSAVHPHRKCIEDKMTGLGPYWNTDGTPTEPTRLQLLRDMGFDV